MGMYAYISMCIGLFLKGYMRNWVAQAQSGRQTLTLICKFKILHKYFLFKNVQK